MRIRHLLIVSAVVGAGAGCSGSSRAAPATTVTTTATISATVTSTVTATATPAVAVVAATEVRACESAHALNSALQRTISGRVTRFASCNWPPAVGAGRDGYLLITATDASTTLDEASNESEYDLLDGPCSAFRLGYSFADMGVHEIQPLVTVPQGAADVDGASGPIPVNLAMPGAPDVPNPGRGQVVYLHNASYTIDSASCLS